MSYKPVDTAIVMVVGPCIDDTDFKSLEEAIAYNAAGMDVSLIVEKTDGTTAVTAITLTTAGTSDWAHKDGGYYEIEITAAQNIEEGAGYVRGVCTGVLPFESAHYNIVKANVYDSWVKGTDVLQADITQLGGVAQSATDLKDFADAGYDPATNKITGTADMRGTDSANTTVPDAAGVAPTAVEIRQEMDANSTKMAPSQVLADYKATGFSTHNAAAVWSVATRILTASTNFNDLNAAAIKAEAVAALADIKLDHLINIAVDTDWATTVHLDSVIGHLADVGTAATFNRTTDALEALRNRGDAAWIAATGFSTHSVADVKTAIEQAGSSIALILADTNELQTDWVNGGRLDLILDIIAADTTTDIPTKLLKYVQLLVRSDAAIATDNATELTAINADGGSGAGDFSNQTDGIEALRDRGDAAWTTGAGGSPPTTLQNTTIATMASQTSFTLTAGSADDNAYTGMMIVIEDTVTGTQKAVGFIAGYVGSTKTITLYDDPGIFTMAAGDTVDIILTGAPGSIADAVWDEILTGATHNIATSAGRRVRDIAALAIHGDTAQAGATTTITLAAAASADDGVYNRNLLAITEGTGAGQTRQVADYNGTTKVAVVDREWRITPDATSVYQITADNVFALVDQGTAQAGTATTITLRAYAASVDDTYLCNQVAIIAGTGRGQARLVGSYNGTTKVATICGDDWVTIPDTTSVYVLMPYGTTCTSCVGVSALTQIRTELEGAGSKILAIETDTNELQTNQGAWATAAGFSVPNEYDTVIAALQTDLDNPAQYKATGFSTHDAAAVKTAIEAAGSSLALILADTSTSIPADIAALNDITVADIVAGISDGTLDLQEMMRIILAATAGKSSGGGTVTLVFRDAADSKARITATVDTNGNRTAMTLDGA